MLLQFCCRLYLRVQSLQWLLFLLLFSFCCRSSLRAFPVVLLVLRPDLVVALSPLCSTVSVARLLVCALFVPVMATITFFRLLCYSIAGPVALTPHPSDCFNSQIAIVILLQVLPTFSVRSGCSGSCLHASILLLLFSCRSGLQA